MPDLTTLLSKFLNDLYAGTIGVGTPITSMTLTRTALGVTPALGIALVNNTAAAAGAQQISPYTQWRGRGWKTDATAGSQTVDFFADVLPVQGAAAPTGSWRLGYAINGGSRTNVLDVSPSAVTSGVPMVLPLGSAASASLNFGTAGTGMYALDSSTLGIAFAGVRRYLLSGNVFAIEHDSAVIDFGAAGDVRLSRGAANLLQLAQDDNFSLVRGYIQGFEQTAPAAPAANGYRIFAQDNGGKTELMVQFASGSPIQIAIEV